MCGLDIEVKSIHGPTAYSRHGTHGRDVHVCEPCFLFKGVCMWVCT